MPEGGKLTVETRERLPRRQSREQPTTRSPPATMSPIGVSDTGSGMPADVIAHAFDPFFTTKPIGQGTGLGLSMVYGFAKQSEGHVRIESAVGQGTGREDLSAPLPR